MSNWFHRRLDGSIHGVMSFMGGFLGTYAIQSRGGIFASAQTGNLMAMAENVRAGQWMEFLLRAGTLPLFAMGIVGAHLLLKKPDVPVRKMSLILDGLALAVTSVLPGTLPGLAAVYPIFVAAGFQWVAFTNVEGYSSATVFSSNNFRQSVTGYVDYLLTGNPKDLEKSAVYGRAVVTFLAGAFYGCVAVAQWGYKGGLAGFLPLALAYGLVRATEKGA